MDHNSYKTLNANDATADKQWVIVDAKDQILGRLASQIARVLRGKHKTSYTPNTDMGDHVVVINAEKVKMTGKKMDDLERKLFAKGPEEVDLVNSGLADTMAKAYVTIRQQWKEGNGQYDMRTAAFIVALNKVASDYEQMGIWP